MTSPHPASRIPRRTFVFACALAILAAMAATAWAAPISADREMRLHWDPEALPGGIRSEADTVDIADSIGTATLGVRLNGNTLRIPYFANRDISGTYYDITRVVVVMHGTLRNAVDYYNWVVEAAGTAGVAGHTLVVAPQFLTESDVGYWNLPDDYLYWYYMGWRKGDLSGNTEASPRPGRISSFSVVDTILVRLVQRLPNLEKVVFAGHSAGGQFANLYTAGTPVPVLLSAFYQVGWRSVVSNPSCYMYFDAKRWVPGTAYEFAIPSPDSIAQCPDYNKYKYGLENPNEYMNIGSSVLAQQYSSRNVVYLLGGADTNPNDQFLDKTCMAEMQGEYRLQRGLVYTEHLVDHFGAGIFNVQEMAVVPGIGHDGHGMFNSDCGLYFLFDYGSCTVGPPPSHWEDITPPLLRAVSAHAASWGDYNGDGYPDLYLAATDDQDKLIRNNGDGTFADATAPPLPNPPNGMGAQWIDLDHDGRLDLYCLNWRDTARLYHNEGGDTFADVTAGPLGVNGDVCSSAWADCDNDGDLDVFITRTNDYGNVLLRNDGADGFQDVTPPSMVLDGVNRTGSWGDYDNDGDLDLFIARGGADKLFRNNGNGTFSDVTQGPLGDPGNGASAAWGDYDNDGRLDLFIVNRGTSNKLLHNEGNGLFSDATHSPLNLFGNGQSASWGDYDNDGLLDLYLCNSPGPTKLYHNNGGGSFADVTDFPIGIMGDNYAAAWGDYDRDGNVDLYLACSNLPNHLFRNTYDQGNHWLEITLSGVQSNRPGIGAMIRVKAGGKSIYRQIGGDAGYLAQNDLTAHFGLGTAFVADSIEIRWPSGIRQLRFSQGGNQHVVIEESDVPLDAGAGPGAGPVSGARGLLCVPNPFRTATSIRLGSVTEGPVWLLVHDPAGRLVRALDVPDRARIQWDGRDDAGLEVASGIYLVRVLSAGRDERARVIRLR